MASVKTEIHRQQDHIHRLVSLGRKPEARVALDVVEPLWSSTGNEGMVTATRKLLATKRATTLPKRYSRSV